MRALAQDSNTESTKDLILAVFNGTTDLKQLEAANLRDQLLKEILDFHSQLLGYSNPAVENEKAYFQRNIKAHLHPTSPFTSFKRWIIRENDRLKQEFHDCV
jgi:hypothetical protein